MGGGDHREGFGFEGGGGRRLERGKRLGQWNKG